MSARQNSSHPPCLHHHPANGTMYTAPYERERMDIADSDPADEEMKDGFDPSSIPLAPTKCFRRNCKRLAKRIRRLRTIFEFADEDNNPPTEARQASLKRLEDEMNTTVALINKCYQPVTTGEDVLARRSEIMKQRDSLTLALGDFKSECSDRRIQVAGSPQNEFIEDMLDDLQEAIQLGVRSPAVQKAMHELCNAAKDIYTVPESEVKLVVNSKHKLYDYRAVIETPARTDCPFDQEYQAAKGLLQLIRLNSSFVPVPIGLLVNSVTEQWVIITEWCGPTMAEIIDSDEEPWPASKRVTVVTHLASALASLHSHNIVHGNINLNSCSFAQGIGKLHNFSFPSPAALCHLDGTSPDPEDDAKKKDIRCFGKLASQILCWSSEEQHLSTGAAWLVGIINDCLRTDDKVPDACEVVARLHLRDVRHDEKTIRASPQARYDICCRVTYIRAIYLADGICLNKYLGSKGLLLAKYIHEFYTHDNTISNKRFDWFWNEAQQGCAVSQAFVAYCFDVGYCVPKISKRPDLALYWYTRSAEQGYAHAQGNLAMMYRLETGLLRSLVAARYWSHRSATQNYPRGQHDLAVCLEKLGQPAEAHKWYERAAKHGHKPAIRALIRNLSMRPMSGEEFLRQINQYEPEQSPDYYIAITSFFLNVCDYKLALKYSSKGLGHNRRNKVLKLQKAIAHTALYQNERAWELLVDVDFFRNVEFERSTPVKFEYPSSRGTEAHILEPMGPNTKSRGILVGTQRYRWPELTSKGDGNLIYLVRGRDHNRPAWHYVLVERQREHEFLQKTNGGQIDVALYGDVLISGWGADPPEQTVKEIEEMGENLCLGTLLMTRSDT